MAPSMLTATQRYATAALFGLALHQAQVHQTSPMGHPPEDCLSSDSVSDDPQLWVNLSSSLLRPIFKFLEINEAAWTGLEETAASTPAKHHVGAYMRLLAQESMADMELGLSKGVDAMAASMETTHDDYESSQEKQRDYANEYREKYLNSEIKSVVTANNEQIVSTDSPESEEEHSKSIKGEEEEPLEEVRMLEYPRKVTVLYELLSACLANAPEDDKKSTKRQKGYDARHRVALRLLSTWFDLKWIKMEGIETMVASSAMALLKEEETKENDPSSKGKWAKWRRGGIIGAAALTGGTLMAITGGLAAPAIAAGFGALAPTLGTIIPAIGASGFAAVATAAGSVAGSVAVAASFGAAGAGLTGSKMARRIGDVKEFEFKPIGENHNQGVAHFQLTSF